MTALLSQLSFGWRSALMGSVLLPIILFAVLLYFRAEDRQAARWLVALMLCTVLSSIPFFIGFAGAYDVWPGLTFLPVNMTLSFAPLLYLYVYSSLTGRELKWRRWLLLPLLVHFVYQLGAFTLLGDYQNKWAFTRRIHSPYIDPVIQVTALVLTVSSFVWINRLYRRYQRWLPTARADEDQFQPVWLKYFMLLCSALGLMWIVLTVMELRDSTDYRGRYWLVIITLLTVLMVLLETLSRSRQPFPKMTVDATTPDEPTSPVCEVATEHDWSELGQSLRQNMIEQQWFLEPGFSLEALSRRAGQNRSYISRALNDGLGQNFSQFVNAERVKHASRLLADGDDSLLEVAYASGFGSKASFNRVFRSFQGCTPTQYRRENGSIRKNR